MARSRARRRVRCCARAPPPFGEGGRDRLDGGRDPGRHGTMFALSVYATQVLTQGYVAEVMEPDKIPADLRYFGNEFPFLGKAVLPPKDEITVPPKDTGNKRCA